MNTPPSKVNAGKDNNTNNDDDDDDIMGSIAALRSVLMLDTPARHILGGGGGRRLSSPSPQQPPRESNILQQRLDDEIACRQTLETTYDNHVKFQKQQSQQLDILQTTRKDLEQQVAQKDSQLKFEKEARFQDRMEWKPKLELLQDENKRLQQALQEAQRQTQESKQQHSQDTQEKEQLKKQLADKEEQWKVKDEEHQVAMQTQKEGFMKVEARLNQDLEHARGEVST
jgi:hypothetical protein